MNTLKLVGIWGVSTLMLSCAWASASSAFAAYVAEGLDALSLTDIGMKLTEAVDAFKLAVNRQSAYDETPAVTRADTDRAALAALVEEYKLVASQFKGKKKEEPAPEPKGDASVS